MALGIYYVIRSPYTPDSMYLRETIYRGLLAGPELRARSEIPPPEQ